jgi:hypothetical protein
VHHVFAHAAIALAIVTRLLFDVVTLGYGAGDGVSGIGEVPIVHNAGLNVLDDELVWSFWIAPISDANGAAAGWKQIRDTRAFVVHGCAREDDFGGAPGGNGLVACDPSADEGIGIRLATGEKETEKKQRLRRDTHTMLQNAGFEWMKL